MRTCESYRHGIMLYHEELYNLEHQNNSLNVLFYPGSPIFKYSIKFYDVNRRFHIMQIAALSCQKARRR